MGSRSVSHNDRSSILLSLREKNKNISHSYKDIILIYSYLQDKVHTLTLKNNELLSENNRLREENVQLSLRRERSGTPKNYNIEQKLFALQEEVTELHRQKGKLAQQVIDLNKSHLDKDRSINQKSQKIIDLEAMLADQKTLNKHNAEKIKELENANKTLVEELSANHRALILAQDDHRSLSEKHEIVLKQFLELQNRFIKLQNEENEIVIKQKKDAMKKSVEEAANTHVNINERGISMYPLNFSVAIPEKKEFAFEAHDGEVNCVHWTRTGKLFASGGSDRRLKLWSMMNGKCDLKSVFTGSTMGITSIDFDLEESFILASSNDKACRLWSMSNGQLRHTLTGHTSGVVAAKFMDDSNKVVTGSADRTLKLWDLRSRACIKTMLAMSACSDVVVNCPTRLIISGHFDKKLRLWDHRGEANTDQIILPGRITGLDISHDNVYVLACTRDDTLRTIDLRMNQVVNCYQSDGFKSGTDCVRPSFSANSQFLCAGSSDGGLYVWNTRTSAMEKVLKEHSCTVVCCDWNQSRNTIVSCDRHRKVIIWSNN